MPPPSSPCHGSKSAWTPRWSAGSARRASSRRPEVEARLALLPSDARLLIHVIPEKWWPVDLPVPLPVALADLPPDEPLLGTHYNPELEFGGRFYKVLFMRPRTHSPNATGRDIVKTAFAVDPVLLAHIDMEAGQVTAVEDAGWAGRGDIDFRAVALPLY